MTKALWEYQSCFGKTLFCTISDATGLFVEFHFGFMLEVRVLVEASVIQREDIENKRFIYTVAGLSQ